MKKAIAWTRWLSVPVAISVGGLVALFQPNEVWVSVAISVTTVAPLLSLLLAIYGDSKQRPFFGGFAICCGSYLLLFFTETNSDSTPTLMDCLITTKAIKSSYFKIFPNSTLAPVTMSSPGGGQFQIHDGSSGTKVGKPDADPFGSDPPSTTTVVLGGGQTATPDPIDEQQSFANFTYIGQSLWAWILGWMGGSLAQFFTWRQAVAARKQAELTRCAPIKVVLAEPIAPARPS